MDLKKQISIVTIIAVITISIIGSSCGGGPTNKTFWVDTDFTWGNCVVGKTGDLVEDNRGKIRLVVKKMNGTQETTFWDDILNYTSSRINSSCVSVELPTSGYHKIFMNYSEFNNNES